VAFQRFRREAQKGAAGKVNRPETVTDRAFGFHPPRQVRPHFVTDAWYNPLTKSRFCDSWSRGGGGAHFTARKRSWPRYCPRQASAFLGGFVHRHLGKRFKISMSYAHTPLRRHADAFSPAVTDASFRRGSAAPRSRSPGNVTEAARSDSLASLPVSVTGNVDRRYLQSRKLARNRQIR